jgi:nucleoside-diphosphate-sugar epimerase
LVCGRRQKYGNVLSTFIKYAIDGKVFSVFGEGKSERDFVHIDDLTRMVGLLLDKVNYLSSTSYNCGGNSVSIANLATMVATKYSGDFIREDISLGEKSEYTFVRRLPEYVDCMKLSLRKSDLELGYMPVKKITDIITDTAWYYVNNKSRWSTYEID